MLTKRIIPCLDVKDGRVVKGTNFVNLKDAGNVVELAERYYEEGADELVFLDITATEEKRKLLISLVKDAAEVLRIPFTVGGGLNTVPLIEEILKSGADKVSLNSAIVKNPKLITESAKAFGSQAVVAAVDVKQLNDDYKVFIQGGKIETEKEGFAWCREVEDRGAGEILLTAMDRDGTRKGYDTEFIEKLTEMVTIPVIASGGAGNMQHFADAFDAGADAALAAGLFHFKEMTISDLKNYLKEKIIPVRI